LCARGVDTAAVLVVHGRHSLSKTRVMVDSQVLVRFDEGDTSPRDDVWQQRLIDALDSSWSGCDAVVVSDYGYGVLSARVISTLEELQRREPKLIVVDSKLLTAFRKLSPAVVKPNHAQAAALVDAPATERSNRLDVITQRAKPLLERTGARLAAVTFDRDGALFLEAGQAPYRTYARAQKPGRASGAGDTFAAALALSLAAGADVPTAAELASAAAAEVVEKDFTTTCPASALRHRFVSPAKLVDDLDGLVKRLDELRSTGCRIVFTNGCFDILHRGHVSFLSKAKSLGEVLVVGVNSDERVARLKGADRPVNSLGDRLEVLAALSCVDLVVPFGEDTPIELIQRLRPNIFVKGGDYSIESLPERPVVEQLGGTVQILPYLVERSTTSILERMRSRPVALKEVRDAG
jgi:D-beta-D-heptose 7-phosphate kinase/D-beta-D-heptose 1-phosphate adenosyltransferase